MPIVGLSVNAKWTFESDLDPDKGTPQASKFILKTLDSRVYGMIQDEGASYRIDTRDPNPEEVESAVAYNGVLFMTCQFGIADWRNVVDAEGNEIEFKTIKKRMGGATYEIVDPSVLSRLPNKVISELSNEITRRNRLTDTEGKGSETSGSSTRPDPTGGVPHAPTPSSGSVGATETPPSHTS